MKTKTNTDFLELLSREEVKLEVFEFKSHTLGELLKATIIRNTINEIVNVILQENSQTNTFTEINNIGGGNSPLKT